MKTLIDLQELKNKPMSSFSNAYVYLVKDIQNDLISKSNGMERVKSKLSCWDAEAREEIKDAVLKELEGMYDFVLNDSEMLMAFAKI